MTDQQSQDDVIREILAKHECGGTFEGYSRTGVQCCYYDADGLLAALQVANRVIVDADRLVSLEHLADVVFAWRNLPEHTDDLEALTSLIDAADAVDPIPAAGEKGTE